MAKVVCDRVGRKQKAGINLRTFGRNGPFGKLFCVRVATLPLACLEVLPAEFDLEVSRSSNTAAARLGSKGKMKLWLRVRIWHNGTLPIKSRAPLSFGGQRLHLQRKLINPKKRQER